MIRSLNRSAARAIAVGLICAVVGACTLDTDVNSPAGMAKAGGDQQNAAVNTTLPVAFQLLVVNQNGEPLKNVAVNWTITTGGGSLSGTPTLTGDGGMTSVTYTTGPTPGSATISAQVHGLFPIVFSVTIT
jgi:hypothetical protein